MLVNKIFGNCIYSVFVIINTRSKSLKPPMWSDLRETKCDAGIEWFPLEAFTAFNHPAVFVRFTPICPEGPSQDIARCSFTINKYIAHDPPPPTSARKVVDEIIARHRGHQWSSHKFNVWMKVIFYSVHYLIKRKQKLEY